MSEEKKPTEADGEAVEGYFSSLIEDFQLDQAEPKTDKPVTEAGRQPVCMKDFSKFFDEAAAFGSGFESTIDQPPEELGIAQKQETIAFSEQSKAKITSPVTDEDGMIVIFDEEAGIDATAAASDIKASVSGMPDEESAAVSSENTPEKDILEENTSADELLDEQEDTAEHPDAVMLMPSDDDTEIVPDTEDNAQEQISEEHTDGELCFSEPDNSQESEDGTAAENNQPSDEEIIPAAQETADQFEADSNIAEHEAEVSDTSIQNENQPYEESSESSFIQGIIPWKGDSAGEVIRKLIFIVSAGVFIGAGVMLISTMVQSEEAVQDLEDIKASVTTTVATTINEKGEIITIPPTTEERIEHNESLMNDFVEVSADVLGFIEIPNCDIYYPVVQGADNDYYLTHTHEGKLNKAGAIFMDYRCTFTPEYTSPNIVLYGHNQEDGTMFGNLKYYKNNVDFYKNNPHIVFNSAYGLGDYVIFGYFITNVYEHQDSEGEVFHYHDYIETLNDENTFNWYMKEVGERNQIISPVDVVYGDKLLVLSTCSNEYMDSKFVVMARKLREGESIYSFDYTTARLNPNARQIDWSAILSEESVTAETTTVPTETTTIETTTETVVTTTTETTVTTTAETSATTNRNDVIASELSLAPKYENGTTASIYSETETSSEETTVPSETEDTAAAPTLPSLVSQIKPNN